MTASTALDTRPGSFIDGSWREPSPGGDVTEVWNPFTEDRIATIALSRKSDVDAAVEAARRAFPAWAATPVPERAATLRRLADAMEDERSALASIICAELGSPIRFADMIQVGLPIYETAQMADVVGAFEFEESVRNSLVLREPIGVVGCITPWNFPLHQITAKLAPALAAGCTTVIKPSELTPLAAMRLIEIIHEIGVPPGVVNMVVGTGPVAGEALAAHPDVDMISFTGSTAAGKRVTVVASDSVKRVALELGGKSPSVILDDADLEAAVATSIRRAFVNGGQTCSALTRLVVPRSRLAEVERIAAEAASQYVIGNPTDSATSLGPLVSDTQRRRVLGYIEKAEADGARAVVGGSNQSVDQESGYFVAPTILSDVDPDAVAAQEEIFGPVVVILAYENDQEAVDIANNSMYGLAGAVWSGSDDRARHVATQIRAGQVEVNGGAFNAIAPFGGYKASGNGREGGRFGLEEYLETKSLQL